MITGLWHLWAFGLIQRALWGGFGFCFSLPPINLAPASMCIKLSVFWLACCSQGSLCYASKFFQQHKDPFLFVVLVFPQELEFLLQETLCVCWSPCPTIIFFSYCLCHSRIYLYQYLYVCFDMTIWAFVLGFLTALCFCPFIERWLIQQQKHTLWPCVKAWDESMPWGCLCNHVWSLSLWLLSLMIYLGPWWCFHRFFMGSAWQAALLWNCLGSCFLLPLFAELDRHYTNTVETLDV